MPNPFLGPIPIPSLFTTHHFSPFLFFQLTADKKSTAHHLHRQSPIQLTILPLTPTKLATFWLTPYTQSVVHLNNSLTHTTYKTNHLTCNTLAAHTIYTDNKPFNLVLWLSSSINHSTFNWLTATYR